MGSHFLVIKIQVQETLYLQCSLTLKTDWKKTENAFEEDNFLTQDRADESLSNVFNCLNFVSLDVTST